MEVSIMEKSTIYIKCPQCQENGLLIERQGQYFCANCMFNYTELKDDLGKLDDILVENMQDEGFGPLFASALHQRVTLTSPAKSNEYIQQLAEKNGIDLFKKQGISGKIMDGLFKLFLK
jgi:hypothetical protein